MTPLQKQMREAIRADINSLPETNQPAYERLGDAAYAVVEPILNDMLKLIGLLVTIEEFDEKQDAFLNDVYARAREALGS